MTFGTSKSAAVLGVIPTHTPCGRRRSHPGSWRSQSALFQREQDKKPWRVSCQCALRNLGGLTGVLRLWVPESGLNVRVSPLLCS
jgi:hypothetical protein